MTCRPNFSVEWKSLLPLWWRVIFCFGRHLGSGHSVSHLIVSAWSVSNASLMGKGFKAEKRSVQASVHPSSQAQGGLFCVLTLFVCVVLGEFWLRLNEIHEVRTFAPYKAFFMFFFVTWKSHGFSTTNVKGKTDHSVSLRWNKKFWTFPNGEGKRQNEFAEWHVDWLAEWHNYAEWNICRMT